MTDTPVQSPRHHQDAPSLAMDLRHRAGRAKRSSRWLLFGLLVTIFSGLGYYIGVPLYLQLKDAERRGLEAQAQLLTERLDIMDGKRNAVWQRIKDGLEVYGTPVASGVTVSLADLRVLPDGQTLVAVGSRGAITRSTDGGESWTSVASDVTEELTDLRVLPDGQTLVAVGWRGAITRSTDGGGSWTAVASGVTGRLYDLRVLPDGQTLVAVGDEGAVTRSTDGGESWASVASGVTGSLRDLRVLPDGQTLVAVGWRGAITRSTDGGESWTAFASGETWPLIDLRVLPDGQTLVAVGWRGAITRSTDGGESWSSVASGVTGSFSDLRVLPDGQTLVALGEGGAITRSTDGGESWTAATSGVAEDLIDLRVLPDGQTLVAVGWRGAITRSTDGGESWTSVASGVTGSLFALRVLPDGQTLVAVGEGGAIVLLDDRHFLTLNAVAIESGSSGDALLDEAYAKLPAQVREHRIIKPIYVDLGQELADRAALEGQRDAALKDANEIRAGGFSLSQRREDFADFMAKCRVGAPDTEHCTAAYIQLRESESRSVWEVVAETTPQAVLLLFLLATLGGLYRYNLRLAGFHDSRADALEMLGMDFADKDIAQLEALSLALAADKVEFGKGNTPSDQAMEIAKAVLARK